MDGPHGSLRRLAGCGDPRRVLERLLDGDPLELESRCREVLMQDCRLVSLPRLYLRSSARMAHEVARDPAFEPHAERLRERILFSLRELMEEDRETLRAALPDPGLDDSLNRWMAQAFQLDPHEVLGSCVRFNDLPALVREVFFAITLAKRRLTDLEAEGTCTVAEGERHLATALTALYPPHYDGGVHAN